MSTCKFGGFFKKALGFKEAYEKRDFKTKDIVKRLGVISPNRVYLNNYPISNPIAVFNAALAVHGENAVIYARIIVGYYMYVSAIVTIPVPLEDIYSGSVSINYYASQPSIYPSTRYDLWGTEDPRVYEIDGKVYMTFTGRTAYYFNPRIKTERTLPITAVREENYHVWRKIHAYVFPLGLREHLISDKDAFLVKLSDDIVLFHRPHLDDECFYLTASFIDGRRALEEHSKNRIEEITVHDTVWITDSASFEVKIGWATPPIYLKDNELIAFAHGVDADIQAYRLYAMQLEYSKNEGFIVKAVTPSYIMEPKQLHEVFGDRPYTVFPCGLWRVSKDKVLITYGAGDFMIGIGEIDINELLGELDKGRIY